MTYVSTAFASCIMPTHNRRTFLPRAFHYFLRQDYPDCELVVMDDGSDPVADLIPSDPRIRYMRLGKRLVLGTKRNLACEEAKGDIIVHWDDDDWMAPRRLRVQISSLLEEQADVCGLDKLLFFDPAGCRAWQYVYPRERRPWLAGGTLCYTKAFWRRNAFPEIPVGEDTHFVRSQCSKRMVPLQDDTFYVAIVHAGNTSPKECRGLRWSPWRGDLRRIMGEDLHFYWKQAKGGTG